MAAYYAGHTTKRTHLLTTQTKKQELHKRAYLSENGCLGKKKSGEWAKSRKGYDRKSDRSRQKNKRGDIQQWDQTDSPEIPDRGKISETPRPPFGVSGRESAAAAAS